MMIKYKLSEVAKDFGPPNKEISEILGKYLKAPRSNAQALNEEELDVIFESLTQSNQIDDIKRVFETANLKKAEEKKPEEKRSLRGKSRTESLRIKSPRTKRAKGSRKRPMRKIPKSPRRSPRAPSLC